MTCAVKFNNCMLIGTNLPNSIVEVNMASIANNNNPIINGITLGSFGPNHKQRKIDIIQKMHVSDDGTLLAILDRYNRAAIFRPGNLNG